MISQRWDHRSFTLDGQSSEELLKEKTRFNPDNNWDNGGGTSASLCVNTYNAAGECRRHEQYFTEIVKECQNCWIQLSYLESPCEISANMSTIAWVYLWIGLYFSVKMKHYLHGNPTNHRKSVQFRILDSVITTVSVSIEFHQKTLNSCFSHLLNHFVTVVSCLCCKCYGFWHHFCTRVTTTWSKFGLWRP